MTAAPALPGPAAPHGSGRGLGLALGALGVVYGDIGTSPLYALRECFHGAHAAPPTAENVLGVLSLVFWALVLVVCVQYLTFILRADNRGEGGVFSLLALVPTAYRDRGARVAIVLSLFGAALLYGDGMITPAISVLSAVEGLGEVTHVLDSSVVPIACGILLALFVVQRRGTARIGRLFGPVMVLWFASLAGLGVSGLLRNPGVLAAANPVHAVRFLTSGGQALGVLASVVLAITGAEALYADLGHFGRVPIRRAWYAVVFPALLLNYFGQGAFLLDHPEAAEGLFYALVPRPLLVPMVGLATAATVIASQALISGAFSLTRQAVQLGYLPRVRIVHTSPEVEGQIYVPVVNRILMLFCLGLVAAFGSSSRLAGAYGIAVTAAMAITAMVYGIVVVRRWGWSPALAVPLVGAFLLVNLGFFSANLLKLADGGWFPLLIAVGAFAVMRTWNEGRAAVVERTPGQRVPHEHFIEDLARSRLHRTEGTAVFLGASPAVAPSALLHHVKHLRVLPQNVLLLSVVTAGVPTVPAEERLTVEDLGQGFHRVVARYGFMQTPDVMDVLRRAAAQHHLPLPPARTSYVLGRETLASTGSSRLPRWRKALFAFLWRNALPPTAYFRLPPGRVVELGTQIEI